MNCKYCKGVELVEDVYGMVCPNCGVVGEMGIIFEGQTMKKGKVEEGDECDLNDMKENPFLSEAYAQTIIKESYDARHLNEAGKSKYGAAIQMSKEDKKMVVAMKEIRFICEHLNLDQSVYNTALNKFRTYITTPDVSIRIRKPVYYACVYLACKELKITRTLAEILEFSDFSLKEGLNTVKKILKVLNETIKTAESNEFIPRFIFNLGITDKKIFILSVAILKKVEELKLMPGQPPHTLAASAVLWATALTKNPIKPKEVERVTGVNVKDLRNIIKAFNVDSLKILSGSENLLK